MYDPYFCVLAEITTDARISDVVIHHSERHDRCLVSRVEILKQAHWTRHCAAHNVAPQNPSYSMPAKNRRYCTPIKTSKANENFAIASHLGMRVQTIFKESGSSSLRSEYQGFHRTAFLCRRLTFRPLAAYLLSKHCCQIRAYLQTICFSARSLPRDTRIPRWRAMTRSARVPLPVYAQASPHCGHLQSMHNYISSDQDG